MARREHESEHTPHQPPPQRDEARFPPQSGACRRVRSLLRDFVDGDLEPGFEREVEDHVHECRDCDHALSRAELELLRLRHAFAEDIEAGASVGDDFAARVRARIESAPGAEPPADFTRVVMERVNREWRKPSLSERLPRRRWLAAAAVIGGLAIGWALAPADSVPPRAYVVAGADSVRVIRSNGVVRDLAAHGALFDGERVGVPDGGAAEVEIAGPTRSAVVGRVRVDGPGELRFERDVVRFEHGAFRIEADAMVIAEVPAAARIELVDGEFDLSIATRRRYDSALSPEPLRSVRLEVLSGRALLHRGDHATVVVAGHVAHFGDWRPLVVEPGMTDSLLTAAARSMAIADGDAGQRALWRGRVVDGRSGLGVSGAEVALQTDGADTRRVTTGPDGVFEFAASDAVLGVVSVTPPSGAGLVRSSARPVQLSPRGGELDSIYLPGPVPFWGTVEDASGQPVAGARVVPFVVDQVFGMCDVRAELAVQTDARGRFDWTGFPTDLAPQQSVAIVIEHASHPTTAYREVDPNRSIGRPFRLDASRDVDVGGLPPDRSVQIVQSVPGLPVSDYAVRREIVTDAQGRATLRGVGPGRLWFHDREDDGGVPLVAASAVGRPVLLADASTDQRLRFDDVPRGDGAVVRRPGHRFASFRAMPAGSKTFLTFIDRDSIVVPGTRLFLVDAAGRAEFVGEYSGREAFRFAPPDGRYSIVAIGPDGSVGWRSGEQLALVHDSIKLEPFGAVEFDSPRPDLVDPAIDHTAIVRFRMLEGALAGREFWRVVRLEDRPRVEGLMPGNYVIEFDSTEARLLVEVRADGAVEVGLPIGVELGRP